MSSCICLFPTRLSVHENCQDIVSIALEKGFPDSGTKVNLFALEGLLAVSNFFFLPNLSKTGQPLPNMA